MAEKKPEHKQSGAIESQTGVAFEKKVNPDGSYVEFITDRQNKRGEIREYDTEGNCLNSVYFVF